MPNQPDIHRTADELDYRREAAEAVKAIAQGGKPTKTGRLALRKATTAAKKAAKNARLAALGADLLATKRDLSGLSGLTLHYTEQVMAEPGFPKETPHETTGEFVIDLKAALRWFATRWQAERKAGNRFNGTATDAEPAAPWLEKWREEKARLARFDRKEREGSLLDRESVRDSLTNMSAILRKLGVSIQQHFGPEAHQMVEEAIDDWERDFQDGLGCNGDDRPAK